MLGNFDTIQKEVIMQNTEMICFTFIDNIFEFLNF